MTIGKLHKLLSVLIENGLAKTNVTIDKTTFTHALEEDGAVILRVESGKIECIPMLGDDGFTKIKADGTESQSMVFVLKGEK